MDKKRRKLILNFLEKYQEVQMTISGLLLVFIALFVTFQVLMRYVFHKSILGLDEFITFVMVWLYMIGGANASAKDSHVECGLAKLVIKNPVKLAAFNIGKRLLTVVVNIKLLQMTYGFFEYSLSVKKYSPNFHLSISFAQCAIFCGLCLMLIFALRSLYLDIEKFRSLKANRKEDY